MPSETSFSRITVTSDADQDIVIQAGVRPAPAELHGAEGAGEGVDAKEPPAPVADAPEPTAAAPAPAPAAAPASAPASRPSVPERPAAPQTRPQDSYRETTLEDLEAPKMSTMQKAIIVVAVLLVVAFVIYTIM